MVAKSPSKQEPTETEVNGDGENIRRQAFQDWLEERKRAERERQDSDLFPSPQEDGGPVPTHCRILGRRKILIGRIPARWESWASDEVAGETLVFREAHLGPMVDDAIRGLVLESGLVEVESGITISRHREGHTFAHFNFRNG